MAKYRVFLSHGSADIDLVTAQLLPAIEHAGAEAFLDERQIAYGDDFRRIILAELQRCNEIVVLLTASSMARPWVCAEIGGSLLARKRIVPVTYGVTEAAMAGAGVLSLFGSTNMMKLDDKQLLKFREQLRRRVGRAARG